MSKTAERLRHEGQYRLRERVFECRECMTLIVWTHRTTPNAVSVTSQIKKRQDSRVHHE